MNLNTQVFSAYNQTQRRAAVGYRSPLNYHGTSMLKNVRSSFPRTHVHESFLPSIKTTMNGGDKPYRRNDFANNHLFIAKQKLAHIFLDQPTADIHVDDDLMHLFDRGRNHRRVNFIKPVIEVLSNRPRLNTPVSFRHHTSHSNSTAISEQNGHLSVIHLMMKPSLPLPHSRNSFPTTTHRRGRAVNYQTSPLCSTRKWVNPAMKRNHIGSISKYISKDELEANAIVTEFVEKQPDIINITTDPLNASLLYLKSRIPSAGLPNR